MSSSFTHSYRGGTGGANGPWSPYRPPSTHGRDYGGRSPGPSGSIPSPTASPPPTATIPDIGYPMQAYPRYQFHPNDVHTPPQPPQTSGSISSSLAVGPAAPPSEPSDDEAGGAGGDGAQDRGRRGNGDDDEDRRGLFSHTLPAWWRDKREWCWYNRWKLCAGISGVLGFIVLIVVCAIFLPNTGRSTLSSDSSSTKSGSSTVAATPTSDSTRTATDSSSTVAPTTLAPNLPEQCKPQYWTQKVDYMYISGRTSGWEWSMFDQVKTAADCCAMCYSSSHIPDGCNGWKFNPCTIIHGFGLPGSKPNATCPNGKAPIALTTRDGEKAVAGSGPCGSLD